ncbi:proteinase-activated receptor 4-like [Spea bombifrons]|uniref:proteinase-activated receptor 4-like n=1 Tax=Spea bombifrons TaxID=233779 RepID=UPI0023490D92|nr:proteinase-activated receptor 4-like [Spea bombifrons]
MTQKILIVAVSILCASSVSAAACLKGNSKGRVFTQRRDNCNSSILEIEIQEHLKSWITTLLIPAFYAMVLSFGLPANGLALWVFVFKIKKMPSTLLLLNLAVADMLFMMVLPFKIIYHFSGNNWIFGETLCKIVTSVFYGNMYCSVFFLMAISIDRYLALVHPFSSKSLRGWKASITISVGIWLVVASGTSIFLIVPQTKKIHQPSITTCHEILATCVGYEWYKQYFLGLFIVGFAIPLLVILFCYLPVLVVLTRMKEAHRNVKLLIFLVLLTFIVFFTPSNILNLFHYTEKDWECETRLYMWYLVALAMTSVNSCIDPFLYYYTSQNFSKVVKQSLFGENSTSLKSTKLAVSSDNKEGGRN